MMDALILAQQDGAAEAAGAGIGMVLCMAVLGVAIFVLWLWALIDAIRNPALDSTMRIVWILVIIFTTPLGPILYLIIGRSRVTQAPP